MRLLNLKEKIGRRRYVDYVEWFVKFRKNEYRKLVIGFDNMEVFGVFDKSDFCSMLVWVLY